MKVEQGELSHGEYEEMLTAAKTANNLNYNILKVVEEMQELGVLLVKKLTKIPSQQPKNEEITEETGDLIARLMIMVDHLDIEEPSLERAESKMVYLRDAYMNKKFGTKITITRNEANN